MTFVCSCLLQGYLGGNQIVPDDAQVYELKSKTASTKHGSRSTTEYAYLLKGLWQELDHYRCIEMKCSEDAVILKTSIEKNGVYDFLASLRPCLVT